MKILTIMVLILCSMMFDYPNNSTFCEMGTKRAEATIRRINGYYRSNGTYVSGHYRDTSGDGNPYNNANYLGLN